MYTSAIADAEGGGHTVTTLFNVQVNWFTTSRPMYRARVKPRYGSQNSVTMRTADMGRIRCT